MLNERSRAFVLGFDGVPWNLVEKWATAGELPNFAKLLEEGAAGPLDSTRPATTALAWPSIATGVWPDKHGLYGFQKLEFDYTQRTALRTDVRQPELWDLLSPAVVGNVPMTYPADKIDGQVVTGMMTAETDELFTHPSGLSSEIDEEIPEYRIDVPWNQYADDHEGFLSELETLVENRRELMRLLMETTDWELFFFVYTAPDRLQHLIWDEEVLLDHYRHLDDVLGEVVEYVSEFEANLFVVSDHGFGPLSKTVHANRILEAEGFLAFQDDSGARGVLASLGITKENVLSIPGRFGVNQTALLKMLPNSLVDSVASRVPGDHALYDVDYENTVALVHGPGNVYVNDTERFAKGCVEPSDVPAVKREVESVLSSVTDPETGEPVLSVLDGDELFPTDDDAPDLVVEGHDEYAVFSTMEDEAFVDPDDREGCHTTEGIFLAWGPDVEPGAAPSDASIVDVAPTVLQTVGGPRPENLDGRVLDEVLESSTAESRQVAVTNDAANGTPTGDRTDGTPTGDARAEAVEDRLRGLGYIE